jgi:hypothetical protein
MPRASQRFVEEVKQKVPQERAREYDVYHIRTKFGEVNVSIPFICAKCGTCCRRLSPIGFGRPCICLDGATNLCRIYGHRFRPECIDFPFGCDSGWSQAKYVGCPAIERTDRFEGILLSGYNCYVSTLESSWTKMDEAAYRAFLSKFMRGNPTREEMREFERLNRRSASSHTLREQREFERLNRGW